MIVVSMVDPNVSVPPVVPQDDVTVQQTDTSTPVQSVPIIEEERPSVSSQIFTQALLNNDDSTTPPTYTPGGKELEASRTVEQESWELPGGMSSTEVEPTPEIPPEVEKYVQAIKDDVSKFPQEVVVAQDGVPTFQPNYVAKPVIVLPLTKQQVEQGLKASPNHSVRWLSEWAKKIWDMFKGEVVYKDDNALRQ